MLDRAPPGHGRLWRHARGPDTHQAGFPFPDHEGVCGRRRWSCGLGMSVRMAQDWTAMPSANSLWASTAEPLRDFPVLSGESQADVVIIGAGYTGLSAAHHIAKRGLAPVVLEANRHGWGSCGRNGGVIIAKFRLSLAVI